MDDSTIDWQYAMWQDRVAVAFGYPSDGWVQLVIMRTVRHVVIRCSDVFPPFDDLLHWLHRIADGDLPAEFTVNEEGTYKHLSAKRSSVGADTVAFVVEDHYWDQDGVEQRKPALWCHVDRLGLAAEFAKRLRRWLDEDYDPMGFGYRGEEDRAEGYGFDLRSLDLAALLAKLPGEPNRST